MITQQHGREGDGGSSTGLLTVNELAHHLSVSRWTVYKLVRDGKLRAVKVGTRNRFRLSDVERYLERGSS